MSESEASTSRAVATVRESVEDDHHGDVCRVCRMEASTDRPLFYPCLCTGSIKYVHQECLMEWLKYSKKEHCELCNHKYIFQPIYRHDMPARLPVRDFLAGLGKNVLRAMRAWFLYTLVAFAWLGVVPLTACRIYRAIFRGSLGGILTLPADIFSPDNVLLDVSYGMAMISTFVCAFVCLVWLSEQITHGGPQNALHLDAQDNNRPAAAAEAPAQAAEQPPEEPPVAAESSSQAHADDEWPASQEEFGSAENESWPSTSAAAEASSAHTTIDVNDDSGNEASVEESLDDDTHLGDEQLDAAEADALPMQDEENAQENEHIERDAPAEELPANEENNNWFDWDRRNEDLSWERLLGLDGSFAFIEHVFWVICLNTLFTLVFAFSPYHVGVHLVRICRLNFAQLHTLVCTFLGYVVIECCVFLMHNISRLARWPKIYRATGICYLVLKVGLVAVTEAILFPTMTGWWLDICSLTLFSTTLAARQSAFNDAPAVSLFIHWLLGMLYVFYFASFTLLLRDVLRPGVLWFLRNLNDPDFNPIQEMLTEPVSWHVHRIVFSTIQIVINILVVVFIPVRIIKWIAPSVLPYNISATSETPLAELTLELLLLQVILPALLEQSHARTIAKIAVRKWCQVVGNMLLLREYLLGKEQEVLPLPDADGNAPPNAHNAAAPQGNVGAEHQAIVEPRPIVQTQPYTKPNYFAARIIALLLCIAVTAITISTLALSVPVSIGRTIIRHVSASVPHSVGDAVAESVATMSERRSNTTRNMSTVHELYSVSCGLYVCYGVCYIILQASRWLAVEWPTLWHQTKQSVGIAFKCLVGAFGTVILIPLLLGINFQLIVLTPLRVNDNQSPLCFPLQDWAMGVLHFKIIIAFVIMGPDNALKRTFEQLYNDGITNLNLAFLYKELVWPFATIAASFIAAPYTLIFGLGSLLGLSQQTCIALQRTIYLCIVFFALLIGFLVWQVRLVHRLVMSIRDEKYLLGQRLVNHEKHEQEEEEARRNATSRT